MPHRRWLTPRRPENRTSRDHYLIRGSGAQDFASAYIEHRATFARASPVSAALLASAAYRAAFARASFVRAIRLRCLSRHAQALTVLFRRRALPSPQIAPRSGRHRPVSAVCRARLRNTARRAPTLYACRFRL